MVVARSLLLPLERVSTFPTRRVSLLLCTQIPERTSMIEILEIRVTPIFCFSERGIQSQGQIPFSSIFLHRTGKPWNHGNLGTRKRKEREREEGKRGGEKRNFVLPSLSFERRYKRRNTSCLVNITGYRPCLGDRNVGQRRAPLPLCIHRSRGSTPRFGAVTTDEFRMSPANGKQRAGR